MMTVGVMLGAAEVGAVTGANSPGLLTEGDYFMGLEAYSVKDRQIAEVSRNTKTSFGSNQYFFLLSYGILDYLMIESRFGVAELNLKEDPFNFGYGFAWGLSARAIMFERPHMDLKVGVGLDYVDYSPRNIQIVNQDVKPEALEWQFSADVSKGFGRFTLFSGVRYSEIEIKIKDFVPEEDLTLETEFETDLKYKQQKELGLVIGGQYELREDLSVTAEAQLFDGETFMLKLTYRY